jgi:hypothetical protein
MSQEPIAAPVVAARAELLARHAAARRRRNSAALGSPDFRAACEEVARIEVDIARLERDAKPPLV